MKYPAEIYAKAMGGALKEADEKERPRIVRRFAALLQKTGDIGAGAKIARAIEKFFVSEEGGRWISIETARPDGRGLETLERLFSKKDRIEKSVNPALVAGARITVDGERELDYSLARKLKKLFKK